MTREYKIGDRVQSAVCPYWGPGTVVSGEEFERETGRTIGRFTPVRLDAPHAHYGAYVGCEAPDLIEPVAPADSDAAAFRVGDRVDAEGLGLSVVLSLAEAFRIRPDLDGEAVLLEGHAVPIKVDDSTRIRPTFGMENAARTGVTYVSPRSLTRSAEAPPAPEPAKSQHPADLKPRGVKAPLGLIPWSVVPEEWAPPGVDEAAETLGRYPDGGRYRPTRYDDAQPTDTVAHVLLAIILSGDLGEVTIEDVAEAFAVGAAKYEPWNWQAFAWDRAAETEYFGAICRHLRAVGGGEERASDSGVRHLGHAAAGCMIWIWHANRIADAAKAAEPAPEVEPQDPFPVGCRVAWDTHRPPYVGTYEAGTGTVLPGRLSPHPSDPDHDTRKVATGRADAAREVYMRTSDLRRVL